MGKIRSLSVLRHIQIIWPLFKLIPAEVRVAHRFSPYPKNSGFPMTKNLGNKKIKKNPRDLGIEILDPEKSHPKVIFTFIYQKAHCQWIERRKKILRFVET